MSISPNKIKIKPENNVDLMMRIFFYLLKQKMFTSDQFLIDNIVVLVFTKTSGDCFSGVYKETVRRGVLVSPKFCKILVAPDFVEFVLGSFSCFNIEIVYSNFTFCGA